MRSPKLIFIILRGGMDGLAAVHPIKNDLLEIYRPALIEKATLPLSQGFAFHPAFKSCHQLFHFGELSFMHAAGLPFRNRSHFKSQDILESGLKTPHPSSGWLARAMNMKPGKFQAVAYGPIIPLILKGNETAFNWSNPRINRRDENLLELMRSDLYVDTPELNTAMVQLSHLRDFIESDSRDMRRKNRGPKDPFKITANLLAHPKGPDIGIISIGGWDTHDDQVRRIGKLFNKLDKGIATLKSELGASWDETVIVAASEFGRSVRQNGTKGTDHGTGGLCLISGGSVNGGKVLGDWPGLEEKNLFEGRDLFPANDIRNIFAKVLQNHLKIPHSDIRRSIFPELPKGFNDLNLFESSGFFT